MCRSEGPTEIHHKVRRWKAGKEKDEPSNLIWLCRSCHAWTHRRRDRENFIRDSPANTENGLNVELTTELGAELFRFKVTGSDRLRLTK
jgi:5-methylcytosine-specific restriction endonuclease McrA